RGRRRHSGVPHRGRARRGGRRALPPASVDGVMAYRRRRARLILPIAVVICWAPIWFVIVVASRSSAAAITFPPPLLPGGGLIENVEAVLSAVSFGRAVWNSVLVSGSIAV